MPKVKTSTGKTVHLPYTKKGKKMAAAIKRRRANSKPKTRTA